MFSTQPVASAMQEAISPSVPDTIVSHEVRPLGPISEMACSGRLGGLVRAVALQDEADRRASYEIILQEMSRKIDELDVAELRDLRPLSKKAAALDLKLMVLAMKQMADLTGCSLEGLFQDNVRGILVDHLGVGPAKEDALHLGLEELLKSSPARDPRGLDDAMRRDVQAAGGRVISFVLEDIFQYPTLVAFVTPEQLPEQIRCRLLKL